MLKAGSQPDQPKITSFFDSLNNFIDEKEIVKRIFSAVQGQREEMTMNVSPLLKQLLSNAIRNAEKLPQQRCHHYVSKKFATSLFIYSGSMTYDFLYRNLSDALLPLQMVQHIVSDNYELAHEGEFHFDELLQHLESYNA